ncbi:TPA: MarR family transcriptional regulator [Clostridioides difficile]
MRRQENRRNENGLTSREQEKQDKISKILELKNKGLNQSEIARYIGISRQAVSKLLKSL